MPPYAICMIAVDAAAAGNSTVNVPLVTVLSPPKAMAQTAASLECESLKIKQPRAVKEADVQLVFEKSQTAVSLSNVGVTLVRAFPLAV